jgi:predicted glycogen debranching enzyme
MDHPNVDARVEWLEADGLGGFVSGTAAGVRTRRYHALLLAATTPPTGRMVLVNGLEAWVTTPSGTYALSSQHYSPGVTHPDGAERIERFSALPWPTWRFRLEDRTVIEQEIFVPQGSPSVVVTWRLVEGPSEAVLSVRPLFSGRDYHGLHHENPAFRFDPVERGEGRLVWRPYQGTPGTVVLFNGAYAHGPEWFRNFLYEEERLRGLDDCEDLASPGTFSWRLGAGEAALILAAEGAGGDKTSFDLESLRAEERRRRDGFGSALERAADAYVVRRGDCKTIVAGYPWFTDWGRDTFISLRGICLATGRLDEARRILLEWAGAVSEGMLPNRFADRGEAPEFNAVDASLWYVIAVHELLEKAEQSSRPVSAGERKRLIGAIQAIIRGYANGTRYRIGADADGLPRAGESGVQLTWMDAKVGDWVVTPRIGKPVEVQALWLNALDVARRHTSEWNDLLNRGLASFSARFWNEAAGSLYDVVDVDHRPGAVDASLRPNQILAVGGLPLVLLPDDRARRLVDQVERHLWTPAGLRSLAAGDPRYVGRYQGGPRERDGAYHQGTTWAWLAGPFVEAWVRVRGGTAAAKREARRRFLEPMLQHLDPSGLGHLAEVADADPPHAPRGCPFQAWSVGEALRLERVVLAEH